MFYLQYRIKQHNIRFNLKEQFHYLIFNFQNTFKINMNLIKNIKGFFYKTDLFYTTELLRYKDEPQYRTLFGGVLSLIIIIGLIVMFYNKFVDTLDKVIINSVSNNLNAADPTPFTISTFAEDNFMFGVEVWHHDLNTGDRYFDVILTSAEFDTGQKRASSVQYPLEQCTVQHWQGFPQVQKDYDRLYMNYWLCLPRNSTYNIQGKYASVFSQTLQVAVKKCTNDSSNPRPCADQATIDQYFQDNGPLFFTIYFINPLLNPTSQQYLTYYLEDNNYIIFTESFGSEGILFVEEYSINTDQSILPFTQIRQDSGGIINQYALKNPYELTNNSDTYCSFAFFKSGISRNYERKFQKLDEILSYIGGLFGTIAILLFMVNIYNSNSFQIALGAYLFQQKQSLTPQSSPTSQSTNLRSYNFLTFISHIIYTLLSAVGCKPNWQIIKKYDDCRQQMKKQLDIRYLIRRIFFIQKSIKVLFEDYQLKGLHLLQNLTLQDAKKGRKTFKMKKRVIQELQSKSSNQQNTIIHQSSNQQSTVIIKPDNVDKFNHSNNLKYDMFNQSQFKFNQTAINDRVTPPPSSRIKIKKKDKSNLQILFQSDSSSDNSSQGGQNQHDRVYDSLLRLKVEGDQGNKVSRKIWQNIDKKLIKQQLYYSAPASKQLNSPINYNYQLANNINPPNSLNLLNIKKQKRNRFSSPIIVNEYFGQDQRDQNQNRIFFNANKQKPQIMNLGKDNVLAVNDFNQDSSPNIINHD